MSIVKKDMIKSMFLENYILAILDENYPMGAAPAPKLDDCKLFSWYSMLSLSFFLKGFLQLVVQVSHYLLHYYYFYTKEAAANALATNCKQLLTLTPSMITEPLFAHLSAILILIDFYST